MRDVNTSPARKCRQVVIGGTQEQLRDAFAQYERPANFKAGDLVTWKPGMKNRNFPANGEPVVVIQVLAEPVFGGTNYEGSVEFREPLTLRIGCLDENDGEFMVFHVDGARFELYDTAE